MIDFLPGSYIWPQVYTHTEVWEYWNAVCNVSTTLFYYSFSQYMRHEIPIFLFSIATKYTKFVGLHLVVQCTYFAMTGWHWNLYVIFIHTLETEFMYWTWQINHQHEVCTKYFHIQYCVTYISHCCHSNHKILNFKKKVHTIKPLPGQLCIGHYKLPLPPFYKGRG